MAMRTPKYVIPLVLAYGAASLCHAQDCPVQPANGNSVPSAVRTLEGKLVYHDGIRKWYELKLDQAQCGQGSIQLIRIRDDWTALEVLRSCRVRSTGAIDLSLTTYYSLDLNQVVNRIEPVGSCTQQPPFPDYSKAKPDKSVGHYRVDMHVNFSPGDHPIVFYVSNSGQELKPWQAYAKYWLTGGFVLYGLCGDGFVIDRVYGTPQAGASHFDDPRTVGDMAAFNPESAAEAGVTDLRLGYTCVRQP